MLFLQKKRSSKNQSANFRVLPQNSSDQWECLILCWSPILCCWVATNQSPANCYMPTNHSPSNIYQQFVPVFKQNHQPTALVESLGKQFTHNPGQEWYHNPVLASLTRSSCRPPSPSPPPCSPPPSPSPSPSPNHIRDFQVFFFLFWSKLPTIILSEVFSLGPFVSSL